MVNNSQKDVAIRLARIACGVITIASSMWNLSADKIIFSDSSGKSEDSRPETTSADIARRFNFIRKSGTPDFSSVEVSPPSIQPINPNLSRKLEDYFDQKKNWMFRPQSDKSTSMEERLGVRESGKFELGNAVRKGAIESYWESREEKTTKSRSTQSKTKSKSGEDSEVQEGEFEDETETDDESTEIKSRNLSISADPREKSDDSTHSHLQNYLNPANRMFGADDRLQENASWRKFDFSARSLSDDNDAGKIAEKKRMMEAHDVDFQQMIQPRNITPSVSGVFDPVNTAKDLTRQESNPFQTFSIGLGSPLGKGSLSPSQPLMSTVPSFIRPPSEVSLAESLGNRITSPAVPGNLLTPPAISTFKNQPKPFVLDFPKRQL